MSERNPQKEDKEFMKTLSIALGFILFSGVALARTHYEHQPILAQNINTDTWQVIGDYVFEQSPTVESFAKIKYKGVCRASGRNLYYWQETSTPYGSITTCEKRKEEKRLTVHK